MTVNHGFIKHHSCNCRCLLMRPSDPQSIQRRLEEIEVTFKELEEKGVQLERVLRGEAGKAAQVKVLGVHLGADEDVLKNWEGIEGKVSAKLEKWKWIVPWLSYRGRALVINNLVASTLWHKVAVITPPS